MILTENAGIGYIKTLISSFNAPVYKVHFVCHGGKKIVSDLKDTRQEALNLLNFLKIHGNMPQY